MTRAGLRMRKLLVLRRDEWIALAQAYWLLLLIPVGLRMTSLKVLAAALARPRGVLAQPVRTPSLEAERVAYLVGVAARYQPYRPTCLVKALATYALLQWQGIGGVLCIGARRTEGMFQAHAWVEHAGRAVAGDPGDGRWLTLGMLDDVRV